MKTLQHQFVDLMPSQKEPGILYISMEYTVAVHLCVCGCGNSVTTPLSPNGWELTFNGESVSLSPSIGNWSLPCQSHYWIVKNEVRLARKWDHSEIAKYRAVDKASAKKLKVKRKRKR